MLLFLFSTAAVVLLLATSFFKMYRWSKEKKENRRFQPVTGENALSDTQIVALIPGDFSIARHLRNVRNNSSERFITVLVRKIIRTRGNTTSAKMLILNIPPGEERLLGHADCADEARNGFFMGYEILWSRYVPSPPGYKPAVNTPSIEHMLTALHFCYHETILPPSFFAKEDADISHYVRKF